MDELFQKILTNIGMGETSGAVREPLLLQEEKVMLVPKENITTIKDLAVGHYDMNCSEIQNLYTYWELRVDGKAYQNEKEQGTWAVVEDTVIITYYNKEHGHAVLTFEDDNTLVGENVWRGGKTFTWTMRRVEIT